MDSQLETPPTLRLSTRGLVSMVMAEAGGKESGGEVEEVGGSEGGVGGREWTAMDDMLLVYRWTLRGGRSETEGGGAGCTQEHR